jgi:hypothetical protein
MNKVRLVKKQDAPVNPEPRKRNHLKGRGSRKKSAPATRSPLEVTTEWLKSKRESQLSAREAFAALFSKPDPQSV